jgi:hypothetical protein
VKAKGVLLLFTFGKEHDHKMYTSSSHGAVETKCSKSQQQEKIDEKKTKRAAWRLGVGA